MNENAWSQFRKPTWEEDISLNHDTTDEFENFPPPAEMDLSEFKSWDVLPDELLNGRSIAEFVQQDSLPIPSVADREYYNEGANARYFVTGLADYLRIRQTAEKYSLKINSFFDFGCASGRVLRHFCNHSDVPELWGSDINGRHVRWLNDYLPERVKVIHNSCIPYIPIADNSIDVASAFSVFTHIDTFETAWLAEIYRVLKPGGLCYLTVQNDDTWKLLQTANEDNGLLKQFKRIVPDCEELLQQDIPAERKCFRYTPVGPYRALVVHSNQYLKKTWGRYFEVLEILPKAHGYMQSVFVGRKKG